MHHYTRPRSGPIVCATHALLGRVVACAALFTLIVSGSTLYASQASPSAQTPALRAVIEVFDLGKDGRETPLSLKGIDWKPASDAMLLSSASPDKLWFPLLPLSDQRGAVSESASIAVGTLTDTGVRRAALGANPIHDFVPQHTSDGRADAHTEFWLEQVIAWLIDSDMPFAPQGAPALNIAMAHLAGPSTDTEDAVTREWFASRGEHVNVSAPWSCDGPQLVGCLDDADLLVIGPGHVTSPADGYSTHLSTLNAQAIEQAMTYANEANVPVLYLHDGAVQSRVARAVLAELALATKDNQLGLRVARAGGAELQTKFQTLGLDTSPNLAAAKP